MVQYGGCIDAELEILILAETERLAQVGIESLATRQLELAVREIALSPRHGVLENIHGILPCRIAGVVDHGIRTWGSLRYNSCQPRQRAAVAEIEWIGIRRAWNRIRIRRNDPVCHIVCTLRILEIRVQTRA